MRPFSPSKSFLFAALVAGLLPVAGERAEAKDYPWCLYESSPNGDGGVTCLYETLDQCRASQAGGGTWCDKNPRYWWGRPGYGPSPSEGATRRAR